MSEGSQAGIEHICRDRYSKQLRCAALDIARQLHLGLLDALPRDKVSAQKRLGIIVAGGDISYEELNEQLGVVAHF